MKFDYDPKKSEANEKDQTRALGFEHAKALWDDLDAIQGEAKIVLDEMRWYRIGMVLDRVWLAVFTLREEVIRIISFRPASRAEREAYEWKKKNDGK